MTLKIRILALFFLAASCGDSGFEGKTTTFSAEATNPDTESGDNLLEQLEVKDSSGLARVCAEATDMKELATTIRFAARENCSWNQNGNLDRRQGFIQAFEKADQLVSMPAKSVVCELDLNSDPTAQLHYDDFLFFSVENHVIFGTNNEAAQKLTKKDGIFQWDFEKVKGESINNFETSAYCLAAGRRCQLPPHDQRGPVSIDLTAEETAPIAFQIADGRTELKFTLAATGDNDDRDCYHTELELNVNIKYLQL